MPGGAVRTGIVCAVWICTASHCGCYWSGTYPTAYLAAPTTAPLVLSHESTPTISSLPPATTQFPVYNSAAEVPTNVTFASNSSNETGAVTSTQRGRGSEPDISYIYDRTAHTDDRERNPIIVIPGVLGSRLVDRRSNLVVWGEFGGDSIDPRTPWGANLISLPMAMGKKLNELRTDTLATETLDALDIRLLGVPFHVNAYRDLLSALGMGGYRDSPSNSGGVTEGYQTMFQFAYDWRRDNVENARLLHQFILDKKAYVEKARKKRDEEDAPPVRFDIVAHSMGGLVARYFLEFGDTDLPDDGSVPTATWAGAEHVERLIVIGTPNAGSLDAIANLVNGESLSRFLPRYEAAILGTMPALYQLLPRTRQYPVLSDDEGAVVDLLDPRVWARYRWGLLDPRQQVVVADLLDYVRDPQEQYRIVYEHLTKCLARAKAFQAAMDSSAAPPAGTTIHLIAGDAHPTVAQYLVDRNGKLTVSAVQPGDGRVTRSSALMDERRSLKVQWSPRLISPIKWTSVNFLAADHLGLTSDVGFTDNILYLLLESPRS